MQVQRSSRRPLLTWFVQGVFLLLLLYFLSRADLRAVGMTLAAVEPLPLSLALLALLPFAWLKALRWGGIIRDMGLPAPRIVRLWIYYLIGLYLGGVTPGQLGDLAKGWYLRNHQIPLQAAVTSVVVDRIYDLLVIAGLGMLALLDYRGLVPAQWLVGAQLGVIGLGFASALLISQRFRLWLADWLDRSLLQRLQIGRLLSFRFSLRSRYMPLLLLITLLSIGVNLWRGWLLFVALDLQLSLFSIFAVIILIAIFQVLPISIAGFGVRETLLIITLQRYGYGIEEALALSLLLLLLNLQQIFVGFVLALFYPIPAEAR